MKTLYESIISSNNAGIAGTIKDLISKMPADNVELIKLNELWNGIGLGLPEFEWTVLRGCLAFGRETTEKSHFGNNREYLIYRPISTTPAMDLFVHFNMHVELTDKEIESYSKKICKKLNAAGKKRGSTIDIKFK